MRLTLYIILAACILSPVPVSAAEMNEIELKDGSQIHAEIVALDGNNFTLRSDTLGTFQVDRSQIVSIRQKSRQSASSTEIKGAAALANDQIKSIQEKMASDKDILDKILSLQDDPDIKAVLEDPEIMKAVASADLSALMANPKFMKLLNKPELQGLAKNSQP